MDWETLGESFACIVGGTIAIFAARPLTDALYRRSHKRAFARYRQAVDSDSRAFARWALTIWGILLATGGAVIFVMVLLGVAPEEW